jgi:hypothetical protein
MTILSLLNRIFTADQTPNNTVSWSGTNGLKGIQDDIAEEIRARGCIVVPTVTDLNSQGKNNSQNSIVQGIGVYTWFPTGNGPANGSNVVMANDGGFWVLQAVGNFFPNVGTDLSDQAAGVNVYAKAGVLKINGPVDYKNVATAPSAPTDGVIAYAKTDLSSVSVLNLTGPLLLTNITTVPATPTGGIVLYSQAGVLKYKDPAGTVHTL